MLTGCVEVIVPQGSRSRFPNLKGFRRKWTEKESQTQTKEFDVKMTNIKFHCLTVLTRSMSFSLSMSFFTIGMVKNGEIVSMFFFDELQIFFHPSYLSPCNFPSTLCLPRVAIRIAGM